MRKEMLQFRTNSPIRKGILGYIRNAFEKLELTLFENKLKSIELGSPDWHILQEKLSHGSSIGIEMEKRIMFYTRTLNVCGEKLYIFPGCIFYYPQNIEIGYNAFFNRGVYVTAPEKIVFGDNVLIGPYTVFNSGSHLYTDRHQLIRDQGHLKAPILIEDDTWIGAQTTILPGITVGKGAVVAAGAVVTKSVAPYTVVAGVPARFLKNRDC